MTNKTSGVVEEGQQSSNMATRTSPSVLVYKTKKEYNNYVPVILSADKTKIISYPAPSDIKNGDSYQMPVQLRDGYLLDKRGIGANVAFLKLTYEEYALLSSAPPKSELMKLIQDSDPLLELCNCGSQNAYQDIEGQLNQLISSGTLRQRCTIIK